MVDHTICKAVAKEPQSRLVCENGWSVFHKCVCLGVTTSQDNWSFLLCFFFGKITPNASVSKSSNYLRNGFFRTYALYNKLSAHFGVDVDCYKFSQKY